MDPNYWKCLSKIQKFCWILNVVSLKWNQSVHCTFQTLPQLPMSFSKCRQVSELVSFFHSNLFEGCNADAKLLRSKGGEKSVVESGIVEKWQIYFDCGICFGFRHRRAGKPMAGGQKEFGTDDEASRIQRSWRGGCSFLVSTLYCRVARVGCRVWIFQTIWPADSVQEAVNGVHGWQYQHTTNIWIVRFCIDKQCKTRDCNLSIVLDIQIGFQHN